MKKTRLKPFYKLRDVEYSTDFNFFLENQISITYTNDNHVIFTSNLETLEFLNLDLSGSGVGFGNSINAFMNSNSPIYNCQNIHSDLLNGRYGKGEFID